MHSRQVLDKAISTLTRSPVHGPWTRAVEFHHLLGPPPGGTGRTQPLWPGGAKVNGARYTPRGGFGSIYLASDAVTALKEVVDIFQFPSAPTASIRTPPWTLFAVDGVLTEVIDLTDPATQGQLNTNEQELTGHWQLPQALFLEGRGPQPPTHVLAQAAFDAGAVVALKYPSAKNPGGHALVVFSDRLQSFASSYVESYDPRGHLHQRLP
jgi:RES domain-containing protein